MIRLTSKRFNSAYSISVIAIARWLLTANGGGRIDFMRRVFMGSKQVVIGDGLRWFTYEEEEEEADYD